MSIKVTMPALSPTMEEGNLAKWLVKEGDKVQAGDVLAEIETDKATMEVESIDDGVVAKLLVAAGSTGVKVNSVIALLAEEGENIAEVSQGANAAQLTAPAKQDQPIVSVGADKKMQPKSETPKHEERQVRIFASPLARRLSKQTGLELAQLKGTGPNGRIIAQDVRQAAQANIVTPQGADAAHQKTISTLPAMANNEDEQVLALFKPDSYQLIPHDSMRKVIAQRLVQSKQYVPHFYVTIDCQLDTLLKIRTEMNGAAPLIETPSGKQPAYKISVNDLVIKAVALSLKHHPDANVSWTQAAMIKHEFVDVGVAVAIPGGLMTPIIRQAERKPISDISNEMKALAMRARSRRLKPDEYQGGATSVSNMGMYGVKSFSAIINPPQSTIFAVGSGEQRPVVQQGALEIAHMMTVTISADHRAVDGAQAAELSQTFKHFIENPISMMV